MRSTSGILKAAGILAVAILAGMGLGWLGSREKSQFSEAPANESSRPACATAIENNSRLFLAPKTTDAASGEVTADETSGITLSPARENLDEDDKIAGILGADADDSEKSKLLLALFPKLSAARQLEAARHLANLMADEDYAPLGNILTNSETTVTVAEFLLKDLVNRANSL